MATEKHSIEDLNKLYSEGESIDKAHFAEQRTNILLYNGNHFKKNAKGFIDRNKDKLSQDTKLKLSENHIQVVCNRLIASVNNQSPNCMFVPNNDNELSDIKDAELCNSVKANAEVQLNYEDKVEKLLNNFVITGEAFQFYYFDPYGGKLVGYKQKTNEAGEPLFITPTGEETTVSKGLFNEQFQPAQGEEPVFEGAIKMEVVHPYNVVRHKSANSVDDSPFLCFGKYVSPTEAKKLVINHPEREKLEKSIESCGADTWKTFDPGASDYIDTTGQVFIKYWFFRKCFDYPNGYFKVQMNDEIITEDELPFGVWPIEYVGFRSVASSPRSVSIIRDLRPAQTHLNYLVSNSAFHLVALGDDKIITQMNTKLQMGPTWNGVRSFSVNGPAPVILQGRDAGQFENAIARQVATIYRLADDTYQTEETKLQDPWAMLFARMSQKLKHSSYAKKFERFLCNGWSIYIQLAKHYYDESQVIKRVGAREAINIKEFKNMSDDGYQIKAKPVSGTLEEQLGASLQIQQVLQYVGKDLPKNVIARMINQMPFLSKESVVGDLLLTDKNIDNDILSLDRGEWSEAMKDDEHDKYIAKLKSRMKQADFRMLPQQVKEMYQQRYQQHVDLQAQVAAELQQSESGFIPMDGGLIKVSIFDDSTNQNMVIPYTAIMWLKDKLAAQGAGQEMLSQLDKQSQNDILTKAAALAQQHQGMGQAVGMQQAQPMPQYA